MSRSVGWIIAAVAIIIWAALQPVLVSSGHPYAVWFWCDLWKVCG